MTTETLDKLYLEWAQYTQARNARELRVLELLRQMQLIIKNIDQQPEGILPRVSSRITDAIKELA